MLNILCLVYYDKMFDLYIADLFITKSMDASVNYSHISLINGPRDKRSYYELSVVRIIER